jgi:glycosyltransferase involved in cell wall biosynthesis
VRPKLLFLVTEDWYFWSHRLPVARAARDAGFEIAVATRVDAHRERICDERFRLCPLPWRRRGDGLIGAGRAVAAIAMAYRREQPDIVHHVALKPVLFGGIAARLAFPRRRERPAQVAAVAGLGSGLLPISRLGRLVRPALAAAVRLAAAGGPIVVQNPEDGAAFAGIGIDPARIVLIRGSGVDTAYFAPVPDPAVAGQPLRVALVARMLRRKGVLDAVAAVRLLRASGVAIELLLAGPPDPDNRDSLDAAALAALAAEPGILWLGRVEDVRTVWRQAVVAVLPKALLEAAACARAIVATDMPGCREVVRHGESGLLVPPHDIAALAEALARLVADAGLRQAMGAAGRVLVERDFGEAIVAQQTLALYQALLRQRARR